MDQTLLILLLLFPILAAIGSLLLLRNINKGLWASYLSTASAIGTLLLSLLLLKNASSTHFGQGVEFSYPWLHALGLEWKFQLDSLASSMMVVVTLIGSLVHVFSLVYMKTDEGRGRYFGCLSLFLFSMTGIVLAGNLLTMFVFWELVGLSSYLLIGHWYHRQSAANAANKAFLANRVGDLGFLAGIIAIASLFGTLDFAKLHALAAEQIHHQVPLSWGSVAISLTLLGIFLGAVGKSAQLPLHVWLADAMEGPTPVSALIHAATMVAAGVYMLVRVSGLLAVDVAMDGFATSTIAWIGGITALLAALMATQQDDIKRVLAYSTLSQLGYMVMAVGCLAPEAGFFHLFTHAWFKALLFLGSGAVIFACHHEQNIWKMGGLFSRMKVTAITFCIGTAALIAVPWITSGFWSKEGILLATLDDGKVTPLFLLAAFVAFLTPFYMTRLVLVAFFGKARTPHAQKAVEVPWLMKAPLCILALLSIIAGWRFGWLDIPSLFNVPTEGWLAGTDHHEHGHHSHHKGATLALITSLVALISGIALAFSLYRKADQEPLQLPLLKNKFYFDEIYAALKNVAIDTPARFFSWVDQIIIHQTLIGSITKITRFLGYGFGSFQNGNLAGYASVLIFGVLLLTFLLLFL